MSSKIEVGNRVTINIKDLSNKKGVVKFIGKIDGKEGQFIGVELDEPVGKNSGEVDNKQYFKVDKKDKGLYGIFIKAGGNNTIVKQDDQVPKQPIKKKESSTTETKGTTGTKPVPPKATGTSRTPATTVGNKNKMSNEIGEMQQAELISLKQELEAANQKIKQLESTDAIKEMETMKQKLKQTQDANRALKIESEKVKYAVNSNEDLKIQEMNDKIAFFQSQRDTMEKENKDLKKKKAQLEAELQATEEKDMMIENLTFKIESLQAKVQKLKGDLQQANTKVKNAQLLGGTASASTEELTETVKALNQMVALLESQLNQSQQKNKTLTAEIEGNAARMGELTKAERKLKSRQQEIQALKLQVESSENAVAFAEKLTLDMFKKDEELRQKTAKLNEYVCKVEQLQNQIAEFNQIVTLQSTELQNQVDEVQRLLKDKDDQQNHVNQLNSQINKYKQKIRELSENNSSLMNSSIAVQDTQDSMMKNIFNPDIYQSKYYEQLKISQQWNSRYLQSQLQFSAIKNTTGVYMINLCQGLPQTYTRAFFPQAISMLVNIKSANDKLYLLFEGLCANLNDKPDIYSAENHELAEWMVIMLDRITILYGLLFKIELALISSQNQEELAEILSNHSLKEDVSRIDNFSNELIQRMSTDNIDIGVNIDPFIETEDNLQKICSKLKYLSAEHNTKLELCAKAMKCIHKIYESIQLYKDASQVKETAQVDMTISNFLKQLLIYLRQCCTNPHIRLKNEMKKYLEGLDLVFELFAEIQINDTIGELGSVYSQIQDIKMLRDTIFTTQYHTKILLEDLQNITHPNLLSKIQTRLTGKVWQEKIKSIGDHLLRFQEIIEEKQELERGSLELKKKIAILQKDIRDKQTTKELHQKRIGELQLKVQQASFLESECKRQTERIKSIQEASKHIQDQLHQQSRRKKELEAELIKTKQNYDLLQTENMIRNKKQKNTQILSADDVSNLGIFKSVLKECNSYRTLDAKKKISVLKQSPVILLSSQNKNKEQSEIHTLRRKLLTSISQLKVDPQSANTSSNQIQRLYEKISKVSFENPQIEKIQKETFSIGNIVITGFQGQKIRIEQQRTKIVSY